MDQNCSKLFLKCFWTALSTWADSETNLFNCTTVYLHLGGCSKLHPPFFQTFRIQHGEQKRSADSTLTEEGTVAGNSQRVPGASCQVGNLAQGWVNALGDPDLSGTLRKGTKEHCQQDVKTSKIVDLALDTRETQMCCLHKKTAHEWQRLVTRQKPCPCCHLQCCGSPCTNGPLRVTSLERGLLCLVATAAGEEVQEVASMFYSIRGDEQVIDRIFQCVKACATDREGATEARCSGKMTCTSKRVQTGHWRLLAAEGLSSV